MNRIAKFEKVSYEQFKKDLIGASYEVVNDSFKVCEFCYDLYRCGLINDIPNTKSELELSLNNNKNVDDYIRSIYDSIKLPQRATSGSAGYDFYTPFKIALYGNGHIKIPTGIRCKIEDGWVLQTYPRSGHGFKYGVHLANTVGVIDADYYNSDNEGHIFIKLVNDSCLSQQIWLDSGTAFCQGIFLPFGITVDDDVTNVRNGGFGSTSK